MVREYGGLEPLASLLSVREPKELLTAITGAVWKCSGSLANVKEFKKMKVVEHLIDLLNNNSGEVSATYAVACHACVNHMHQSNCDGSKSIGSNRLVLLPLHCSILHVCMHVCRSL